jgi:hypothetical protein
MLEWTEWAAIYLRGWEDSRDNNGKLLPAFLKAAWERYEATKPRLRCQRCLKFQCECNPLVRSIGISTEGGFVTVTQCRVCLEYGPACRCA